MSKSRTYRLQGLDYEQQALAAPEEARPMFRLLARSWFELAEREEVRARLGERRSFAA